MDPSSQALRKVKEQVTCSRSWARFQRELQSQLRRLAAATAAGGEEDEQLQASFDSLSPSEKTVVVERAVEAVGESLAYARLQSQVASAVDRHFGPFLSYHPSLVAQEESASSSFDSSQPLAEACSLLLQSSPHLRHSLRLALNHPLPCRLRPSAWRSLLDLPDVRSDFMAVCKEMEPTGEGEREIQGRCRALLDSSRTFSGLARSGPCLAALQAVTLFWKRRRSSEGDLLDSELLLCVPFVHVWSRELERHVGEGKGEGWLIFAEIAAEYVHLMEVLPSSISSSTSERYDGMSKFAARVEQLLCTEDPQLYKALQRTLAKKSSGHSRGTRTNSFHHTLKSILLSHIQKMLVGDVSMDVLCYIWDQCFIGLDVPEYQCLPYFTTVWLILQRDRLSRAASAEAVEEVLSTHSHSLTISQFQTEVEKRFLSELSLPLKVKPLPLHPRLSHPLFPPPHPHSSHTPLSHTPPLPPLYSSAKDNNTHHIPSKTSRHNVQQRMVDMQQKVEREQRILSHRIREEREHHQKQLELFRKELEELKLGLSGGAKREQFAGQSQSLRSTLLSPMQKSSTTTQPTLLLVDPSRSKSDKLQEMRVIPVKLTSEQLLEERDRDRPFSPTHLSESDVQTLWLKILQRFTAAAYTICHGTGSERQALFSTLHPPTTNTES